MDELFLHDRDKGLFKQILNQSTVIGGRYFISSNGGNDLNTGNIESFINDALAGITDAKQKYPACICFPPFSHLSSVGGPLFTEKMYYTLFFVCPSATTGQNQVKQANAATNTSTHHIWYTWKDMKEVALQFLQMLKAVIVKHRLKQYMDVDFSEIPVTRLTKFGNDGVSGVRISLPVDFIANECDFKDYSDEALGNITLPDFNIHLLHKH